MSDYISAVLTADVWKTGRARRSALLRHRYLTKRPMGLILWQLGAEPFTAAAVGWGFGPQDLTVVAPGEPRDRELAFRELTKVAKAFNRWFETPEERDEPPQIVLPNRGNLTLLGRLGRRLAFLPTDGDRPADPELVRFGRHLLFLAQHARRPGQQLVVVLTDLLSSHWVTGLSPLEDQNLPALDAAIAPPAGKTAHEAAFDAEKIEIGPLPPEQDDEKVDKLLQAFNAKRKRSTDESIVNCPEREAIRKHYRELVERGWPLLWRCMQRERPVKDAPSVGRRWKEDLETLDWHIQWVVAQGGRYRTRDTHPRAARRLRKWEEAQRLLQAEEAVDDPLRMAPYLLANQAVAGKVVGVDMAHYGQGPKNRVRRPLVALETDERCTIPRGKALFWTETPDKRAYVLVDVSSVRGGSRWRITLEHATGSDCARPEVGREAVFSIHHTNADPPLTLPDVGPWTHQKPVDTGSLEEAGEGAWE